MTIGAFLAAFALEVFFIPNNLIDGGIVGVAMIFGKHFGKQVIPFLLILFNLPFLDPGLSLHWKNFCHPHACRDLPFCRVRWSSFPMSCRFNFRGDSLEVVVIGGAILGVGIGLIIREGGCLGRHRNFGNYHQPAEPASQSDKSSWYAIFLSLGHAGFVFKDWHPPLMSLDHLYRRD